MWMIAGLIAGVVILLSLQAWAVIRIVNAAGRAEGHRLETILRLAIGAEADEINANLFGGFATTQGAVSAAHGSLDRLPDLIVGAADQVRDHISARHEDVAELHHVIREQLGSQMTDAARARKEAHTDVKALRSVQMGAHAGTGPVK